MADFREFHQRRAAAAADVLSRGGLPAIAGGFRAADRFRAKRKLRQPDGGKLYQAHRLAGIQECSFNKRQRYRDATSVEEGVLYARGASDVFDWTVDEKSHQF